MTAEQDYQYWSDINDNNGGGGGGHHQQQRHGSGAMAAAATGAAADAQEAGAGLDLMVGQDEGWTQEWDEGSQSYYWYNIYTGDSRW